MIIKKILIAFLTLVVINANFYGARAYFHTTAINKIKDQLFDVLLPESKIEYHLKSKFYNLITLENPNGVVIIKKQDVNIEGSNGMIQVNVQQAQVSMQTLIKFSKFSYNVNLSPSCSFSLILKPSNNEKGQFMIERIILQNFELDQQNINLPQGIDRFRSQFAAMLSLEIQKQIQEVYLPQFVEQINQNLFFVSPIFPVPEMQIAIDTTFQLSKVTNKMMVFDSYFLAFAKNKQPINQQGQNPYEFPISDQEKFDLTLQISEYSLNSALKAMFEAEDLIKEFDATKFKDFMSLDGFFYGISNLLFSSKKVIIKITALAPPIVIILENRDLQLGYRLQIEIFGDIDDKLTSILKLKAQMRHNVGMFVKDNGIYFELNDTYFDSLQLFDSNKEISGLKPIINIFARDLHWHIDQYLLQYPIIITNNFFSINQPKLAQLDHYIQIQGELEIKTQPQQLFK